MSVISGARTREAHTSENHKVLYDDVIMGAAEPPERKFSSAGTAGQAELPRPVPPAPGLASVTRRRDGSRPGASPGRRSPAARWSTGPAASGGLRAAAASSRRVRLYRYV